MLCEVLTTVIHEDLKLTTQVYTQNIKIYLTEHKNNILLDITKQEILSISGDKASLNIHKMEST